MKLVLLVGSVEYDHKEKNIAYNKRFNSDPTSATYMWGAPWSGSDNDVVRRVDMFIKSKKGYINGKLVDYTANGFSKLIANEAIPRFSEQFIQYTYSGETISDDAGEDIESITGGSKAQKRIIIRYVLQ